ncbi:MAG: radical SAM protein [Deltaproteobacteria bacterium]|nr:radical SAM protein [Deltaproteobacteria bacterium]
MRIYPVFLTNQGCPSRCVFCAQDRTTHGSPESTPRSVKAFLDGQLPQYGTGEVAFYGGSFTLLSSALQADYLEIAQSFVKAGRVDGIRVSTRPDALEDHQLSRLAAAGVTTIEVGCQSFDNRVLSACGRDYTAKQAVDAIRRCRCSSFRIGLQLMPGLPEACRDEAMISLSTALKLQPDFLRIYPTVVIAGTRLARLWREGRYQAWPLEDAVDVCADMLLACLKNGVPVIRIGLQHDRSLEDNLLDGPYHPAFGQLVRSRLWRRAVDRVPGGSPVRVNPRDLSDAIGHHAQNRLWLTQKGTGQNIQADQSVVPGWLAVDKQSWPMKELAREGR